MECGFEDVCGEVAEGGGAVGGDCGVRREEKAERRRRWGGSRVDLLVDGDMMGTLGLGICIRNFAEICIHVGKKCDVPTG